MSNCLKALELGRWKTEKHKGCPLSELIKQINPEYLIPLTVLVKNIFYLDLHIEGRILPI